ISSNIADPMSVHSGSATMSKWYDISSMKTVSRDGQTSLNSPSIVELNLERAQAFRETDNHICAAFNGELYGYDEIRHRQSAYKFKSKSSSDTLQGVWTVVAIAFTWRILTVFLRPGGTMFYCGRVVEIADACYDHQIVSEMRISLPFGWQPAEDIQSKKDVEWPCNYRTILEGVQKILSDYYLVDMYFIVASQHKYWNAAYDHKREVETRSKEGMIQALHLLDAVQDRLHADVLVGIILSGCIHSSAIGVMVENLMVTEGVRLDTTSTPERTNCCSLHHEYQGRGLTNRSRSNRSREYKQMHMRAWHASSDELEGQLNISLGIMNLSLITFESQVYSCLILDFRNKLDFEGSEASGPTDLATAAAAQKPVNNTSFLKSTQIASLMA
ncbi:hypothetical protein J1614_000577, partial [Plenodomus biglobosus]